MTEGPSNAPGANPDIQRAQQEVIDTGREFAEAIDNATTGEQVDRIVAEFKRATTERLAELNLSPEDLNDVYTEVVDKLIDLANEFKEELKAALDGDFAERVRAYQERYMEGLDSEQQRAAELAFNGEPSTPEATEQPLDTTQDTDQNEADATVDDSETQEQQSEQPQSDLEEMVSKLPESLQEPIMKFIDTFRTWFTTMPEGVRGFMLGNISAMGVSDWKVEILGDQNIYSEGELMTKQALSKQLDTKNITLAGDVTVESIAKLQKGYEAYVAQNPNATREAYVTALLVGVSGTISRENLLSRMTDLTNVSADVKVDLAVNRTPEESARIANQELNINSENPTVEGLSKFIDKYEQYAASVTNQASSFGSALFDNADTKKIRESMSNTASEVSSNIKAIFNELFNKNTQDIKYTIETADGSGGNWVKVNSDKSPSPLYYNRNSDTLHKEQNTDTAQIPKDTSLEQAFKQIETENGSADK